MKVSDWPMNIEYIRKAAERAAKHQLRLQMHDISRQQMKGNISAEQAIEQMLKLVEPERCACGCGNVVPEPPYESGGKNYSSAYCILNESESCYMCGGYTGDKELSETGHDFRCACNWSALDQ